MIDGQIWCYFSAGDKNHSFHTSFNPADCHMDKLAEKLLEDGQFSTHVAVPASWRQISTPNHLKWFKVYEAWPVKSIISSCYIMNFIFVISSGFWGFGLLFGLWLGATLPSVLLIGWCHSHRRAMLQLWCYVRMILDMSTSIIGAKIQAQSCWMTARRCSTLW